MNLQRYGVGLTVAVLLLGVLGAWAAKNEATQPSEKRKIARMVFYSGQVQGVGFRDTAVKIARKYPVTGWVKNLDDGRVQLLVEGPEETVPEFLKAIRKHWGGNIEKEDVKEQAVSGKHKTFEVVR